MSAPTPLRNASDFDLREAIRDVLAKTTSADPDRIAPMLIGLLPNDVIDALVFRSVRNIVREELRLGREHPSTPGTSRWQRHRLVIDGLGTDICVAGEWKSVAACTPDDLDLYARAQRKLATGILASAEKAEAVAREVREAGAATVGDLYAAARTEDLAA